MRSTYKIFPPENGVPSYIMYKGKKIFVDIATIKSVSGTIIIFGSIQLVKNENTDEFELVCSDEFVQSLNNKKYQEKLIQKSGETEVG